MVRCVLSVFLGLFMMSTFASAQGFWVNRDTVYMQGATTVAFYPSHDQLLYPMIRLNGGETLILEFDDMRGGFTDLLYTLVHCDANWMPSQLQKLEYIDGFEEERMRDFAYSIATFDEYTHYRLRFPNENMDVRVSGNYLLHIYQDDDDKTPILTRRFMVYENIFTVIPRSKQTIDVSKLRTHQEIDFVVNLQDTRLVNPISEVRAMIMQNGRWDNAIYDIPPQSLRGEDMVFDYLDKIVFPAGKEFRNFDTRSVIYKTERVKSIELLPNGVDVFLHEDRSRASVRYITYPDANGRFVTGNRDRFQEPETMSEYPLVHFTLEHPEIFGKDVYVMGGLTDWQLDPRFKMTYNRSTKSYEGAAMLKQGFYDYMYVTTEDGYSFDHTEIEGNWAETENNYTIVIYWRKFGERYDRIAAIHQFNTVE